MKGPLFAQFFSLPGPIGRFRRGAGAGPTVKGAALIGTCTPRPSAGIESELKLLMPLSSKQSRLCKALSAQADIGLAYFRPRETRRTINQVIRNLPYLVVDDEAFSLAELGTGHITRGKTTKRGCQLGIHVVRVVDGSRQMVSSSIAITNKLATLLEQEADPARRARLIMKYAGPFRINGQRFTSSDFVSARLREVRSHAMTQRFLDLKGRRHGSHHLHRAEVSIPVSPIAFQKLLKRSDGGVVRKTRSTQVGLLADARGATIAAEVDILFTCGKRAKLGRTLNTHSLASQHGLSEFALVEIELPRGISRKVLINALLSGAHSLSVLQGPAISLSFRSKRGWELLGMKRLAARGLESSAQELLKTLLAPYSRKQRS